MMLTPRTYQNVGPSPHRCSKLFWATARLYISGVTANNIGIGEGGTFFHFETVSILARTSAKNRYFCNVSQQVFFPRL